MRVRGFSTNQFPNRIHRHRVGVTIHRPLLGLVITTLGRFGSSVQTIALRHLRGQQRSHPTAHMNGARTRRTNPVTNSITRFLTGYVTVTTRSLHVSHRRHTNVNRFRQRVTCRGHTSRLPLRNNSIHARHLLHSPRPFHHLTRTVFQNRNNRMFSTRGIRNSAPIYVTFT